MVGMSAGRLQEVYPPGSAIHRLLDHLKCMMSPPVILTEDQRSQVVELVLEFQDGFVSPYRKVGFTDQVKHKINTEDAVSVKLRYQWKSFLEKKHIYAEVEILTNEGQIRPSKSPWGALVILVKNEGRFFFHFCIDYHRLNSVMKKDAYPLAHIEKCLDVLNGCHYFHAMDLACGYWQVAMDPTDREKTAFSTHKGLYE